MPLLAPCRPRPSSTAPCAAAWVRTRHRATKAVSADRARSGDNGPRYARSIEATISRCSIAAFPRPRARCRSTWNKELPMRTFIALDLPPDFADDAAALASRTSACRTWRFPKTTRRTTSPFTRARSTARAPLTSRCTQCASEPSQPSVPSPLPPAGRGSPCGRTGRGSRRGRSSVRAPTWSSPQAPRWSCRRP